VQLRDIPQTRIACTGTLPHRDPALLERARAAGRLWVTDAGHDLMITEPNAVAELLLRVPAAPQTYQSGSPRARLLRGRSPSRRTIFYTCFFGYR
jgi:hypothetical protein